MFKNVVFRIIVGLVLLAAIAGIAFFAYQAGGGACLRWLTASYQLSILPLAGGHSLITRSPFRQLSGPVELIVHAE
jgi:hypothetical protein